MNVKRKAEIKDQFLAYAVMRARYFSPKEFLSEFVELELSYDELIAFIQEMISFDNSLFDVLNGNGLEIFLISAGRKAEAFLRDGGFIGIYEKEEGEWKLFLSTLFSRNKHKPLTAPDPSFHPYLFVKKDIWYYLWIVLAILGFLYAVVDGIILR